MSLTGLPVQEMFGAMSKAAQPADEMKRSMADVTQQLIEFQSLMVDLQRAQASHSMVMHAKQDAIKGIADFAKESMRKSN
jgi:hypothetical protein